MALPTFEQKIAAYRAQKLAEYRTDPYWKFVRSVQGGEPPPESLLWQLLWAIGIKIPPQEFLGPALLFGIMFAVMMLVCGLAIAFSAGMLALDHSEKLSYGLVQGLLIGAAVCSAAVATIGTLAALSQKRRFGFSSWEEYEPLDEPFGPPLKEMLASKDDAHTPVRFAKAAVRE